MHGCVLPWSHTSCVFWCLSGPTTWLETNLICIASFLLLRAKLWKDELHTEASSTTNPRGFLHHSHLDLPHVFRVYWLVTLLLCPPCTAPSTQGCSVKRASPPPSEQVQTKQLFGFYLKTKQHWIKEQISVLQCLVLDCACQGSGIQHATAQLRLPLFINQQHLTVFKAERDLQPID